MTDEKTIQTSQNNHILTLRLNRPKVLNALSTPLMEEVIEALHAAEHDSRIRVIIITGSEKAFAAGADISEMADQTFSTMEAVDIYGRLNAAFAQCRKPVIAAVSGFALGGGCELAMLCDFILAAENAKFGQPEIKLGTLPGIGGSQRLTKRVGRSKAMELCLTGRFMDADEAERSGLTARTLPTEGFMDKVQAIAEEIAGYSMTATRLVKQAVQFAEDHDMKAGLAHERALFYASFSTHDQKEGMKAFLDKRDPDFQDK
tara:strand:+ start:616 stop:1395 length:780 start_codon:yes stop_codon:yes gene_type:complete